MPPCLGWIWDQSTRRFPTAALAPPSGRVNAKTHTQQLTDFINDMNWTLLLMRFRVLFFKKCVCLLFLSILSFPFSSQKNDL